MSRAGQKSFSKTRKTLRYGLAKYPNLKKIAINLHAQYCNITGNLHTLPDFYIIGVVKGGTTSLFEYLMMHPNTIQPIGKEIDFFGEYYKRGVNWYKCCFPLKYQKNKAEKSVSSKIITGEATPRYIDYPHAAKRIKALTPNAKFILLLRNPIERAYSHYVMNFNNGDENLETLSFEEAIQNEEKRISGEYEKMIENENYYSWKYYDYGYLNQGIYAKKIKNWYKVFPKESLLILQSEKMFSEPKILFKRVLEFLNLPEYTLDKFEKFKPGNYSNAQKIQPEIRKKLEDYFENHNKELYQLLGEEFNWN